MKQNSILKRLDDVVARLNNGEKVELGEAKVLWELSYVLYRDLLVNIYTNKLEITQEAIEMFDKLTAFTDCILKHYKNVFPLQIEKEYVPSYPTLPYYPPTHPTYNYPPTYNPGEITCTAVK